MNCKNCAQASYMKIAEGTCPAWISGMDLDEFICAGCCIDG